jgi:hypothetical protein
MTKKQLAEELRFLVINMQKIIEETENRLGIYQFDEREHDTTIEK